MAARLKTRLSAGAALVTGIGMMGVATALPAQAETTLTYNCSVVGPDGTASQDVPVTVTLDTNAPDTVGPGEILTVDSVTAAITIPVDGVPADADTLAVAMTIDATAPVRTGGEVIGQVATTLTSGDVRVGDGQVEASLSSTKAQSIVVPAETAGLTFDLLAPPTLSGTLTIPVDGSPTSIPVDCTTTSTDSVIDSIIVTSPEMAEEPDDAEDTAEVNDPADGEQPPAGDAPAEEPAVPQVVQTDGLTPQMLPQEDHTAGYALGGLLLAGAGAGTVLVVRRRAQQH